MSSNSTTSTKDFTKVFPYASCTKAIGKPTYEAIVTAQKELYACASSVPSTRGGGLHGELGLVMTPAVYALIAPGTPYARPINPGDQPAIPERSTGPQIQEIRAQHTKQLQEFHDINQLERQLINYLLQAFDRKWLNRIQNQHTGTINKTVPAIFDILYHQYGQITPQRLIKMRDDTTALLYNASDPIDQLWTHINDYSTMANAAKSPATSQQLIDIGKIILQRAGCFTHDLRLWNARPIDEQTWPNFQDHFSSAQRELELAQPQANTMGFHQSTANSADAIANRVIEQLRHEANSVQPAADLQPQYYDSPENNAAAFHYHQQQLANAANHQQSLHQMMSQLHHQVQTLQSQLQQQQPQPPAPMQPTTSYQPIAAPVTHQPAQQAPYQFQPPAFNPQQSPAFHQPSRNDTDRSNHRNRGRGRGRGRGGGRNNNRGPTKKYCWTHGCTGHSSHECLNPLPHHQSNANFNNMLGGNTAGCFWLPQPTS